MHTRARGRTHAHPDHVLVAVARQLAEAFRRALREAHPWVRSADFARGGGVFADGMRARGWWVQEGRFYEVHPDRPAVSPPTRGFA